MAQARENAFLWDDIALVEWYAQIGGAWPDWLERRIVMNRVNPQRDEVILDAGCGTGRFTLEFARKCKKVYAIDSSPLYIDALNERTRREGVNNVESFTWDITQPFPLTEPVDKVLSCQVVQHIPTERQRHQAFQNMYDQLCDTGTAVICLYNWRSLYAHWNDRDGLGADGDYRHRFTSAEATVALQDCGFAKVSIKGYVNFGVYSIWKDRSPHIQHLIARIDAFFSRLNLSRAFGHWLICTAYK